MYRLTEYLKIAIMTVVDLASDTSRQQAKFDHTPRAPRALEGVEISIAE
jgi:hypothetical protein